MSSDGRMTSGDQRILLTPKLVLGASIALAGILLTLDNLDLLRARTFLRFWPVVLITIGALMIGRAGEGSGRVGGGVAVAVGTWLLLVNLDLIQVSIWEFFWPIVLICLGTSLVLQTLRRGREPLPSDPSRSVSLFAMMSGSKHVSSTASFRGGEMTAFMGGCELDLRQAAIEEGGHATLDVVALMGGHEIRVPPGWRVASRIVAIMGGVVDKTLPAKEATSPVLVLQGFVLMGGVEIKN
jgi:hypothetical protein